MDFTAAAEDKVLLLAGDATDASFGGGELTAFGTPQQVGETIREPKKGGFLGQSSF
jgi:hypothetical protein